MERFTADDAFEDASLTFKRSGLIAVLRRHGIRQGDADYAEFFETFGERDEYVAADVLGWLGY
jgi:hypothetical protein